jgi:diguanylate cyclase (GGDEF)-like protein
MPMSELVDHLAELTGFRDRDLLDTTLAGAIREAVQPQEVAIYRCVGEVGDERWMTRARLCAGDAAASVDPAWIEPDQLPRVIDHPERLECLIGALPTEIAGTPHISIFPVTSDREVVGVIELRTECPLEIAQYRMINGLLRIYQNFLAVLDYGERDTLTGLLNRKTFDDSFLKVTAQAASAASMPDPRRGPIARTKHWLGVIDIDHFKAVNDGYGHLIGDEVLLLLARLMRSTFRTYDRLYRFGGEEFVVLLRCATDADATVALERFRANVEGYRFPQVGQITVSVGFTDVRTGDTPSAAFERADKAVYYAKRNGRNQVASHGELLRSGQLLEEQKVGDVELF